MEKVRVKVPDLSRQTTGRLTGANRELQKMLRTHWLVLSYSP